MFGLRPFQIALLTISVLLFFGAIAALALYKPPTEGQIRIERNVTVWGTLDRSLFSDLLSEIRESDDRFTELTYFQLSEAEFIPEFVDALAEQRGPDLIIISHDQLTELRPKLFAISYEFYPERDFRDQFVEGAEIFMLSDGLYALPFAVDPLVMYWNRDTFSSNNLAFPPRTWEVLRNDTTPKLTRRGGSFDILHGAVAFGEYRNVRNAREILSLLMLQSGSELISEESGKYSVELSNSTQSDIDPAAASLSFYTEFANPTSPLYSWNRSLQEDRSRFLSADLALYFGYGSEFNELEELNPNLNFDMAEVPQGDGATILRNFGTFYGFAIPIAAPDTGISYQVASILSNPENSKRIADRLDFASVHRSVVAEPSNDPFQVIRNKAALIAHGWLEPNKRATEAAFQTMVEDVTSGRMDVSSAIGDAAQRLRLAF